MAQRIGAIVFIFLCATAAWVALATSVWIRTNDSDTKLRPDITATWGAPQEQCQPSAALQRDPSVNAALLADNSRVDVTLALQPRQKGLLWYSTYSVDFIGEYSYRNPDAQARWITFNIPFPSSNALYDGLSIKANGQPIAFTANKDGALASVLVGAGAAVAFESSYTSQGLGNWRYKFGNDVTQTKNFQLVMHTNFEAIDFPVNTLSPKQEHRDGAGWTLVWNYADLISGFEIGMTMPEKLQPGPLAGEVCRFAPISLLLFFFVMFLLTSLRGIELHPMHYFFLAGAFFAFHLLLAYLVDVMPVDWAFLVCSLVSVALVVSYLRIAVGARFAILQAGGAQLLYLMLFSYTFFLKGFTGLAITIGCILTLFVSMQLTARVKWSQLFSRAGAAPFTAVRQ